MPEDLSIEDFWRVYGTEAATLDGLAVRDPFMGGGSTLVEAQRLGALGFGTDVDPLAVEIVRAETAPGDADALRAAGKQLLDHLKAEFVDLYPAHDDRTPLHYFMLPEVTCPECAEPSLLYRDLVLARDAGKRGAVVRDQKLVAFWPEDLSLHVLDKPDRQRLSRDGRRRDLYSGTFSGQLFQCPFCGTRSSHRDLQTGTAPLRLVAVEDTVDTGRRDFRAPSPDDAAAQAEALVRLHQEGNGSGVSGVQLETARRDERPLSYGIRTIADLHTPRQALVLGAAFAWVESLDDPVSAPLLRMALSNAVATNNRLCSYARDYGRLSGLFSVRGYSIPALTVELNPLHPTAGRGTLAACIQRVARALETGPRRTVWDSGTGRCIAVEFADSVTAEVHVSCQAAGDEVPPDFQDADLCFFDPPYFDYIAYDELSEIYRGWLGLATLGGTPLLPESGERAAESFGLQLGSSLRSVLEGLRPGRPIAFTYHSAEQEAWEAIGIALDDAKLRVTAMWPIRSDAHMGHHGHPGNCEWDVLVVVRRIEETQPAILAIDLASWRDSVRPLMIGDADGRNLEHALDVGRRRFGSTTLGGNPK
jgi:putative DNA methylase